MGDVSDSIEVVLADLHPVTRIGTRKVLERAGLAVIGETKSGEEALRLVHEQKPDVLVCEMNLLDLSGLQVAARIADDDSAVQVLALSAYDDERHLRHLAENGIAGYFKKSESPDRIVAAVRALARGEGGWLSPQVAQKMMGVDQRTDTLEKLEAYGVTGREQEVLRLMAKGLSNQQIADALFISRNTVRTHVSHLYGKLEVSARRKAIVWAWKHGLMEGQ